MKILKLLINVQFDKNYDLNKLWQIYEKKVTKSFWILKNGRDDVGESAGRSFNNYEIQ